MSQSTKPTFGQFLGAMAVWALAIWALDSIVPLMLGGLLLLGLGIVWLIGAIL